MIELRIYYRVEDRAGLCQQGGNETSGRWYQSRRSEGREHRHDPVRHPTQQVACHHADHHVKNTGFPHLPWSPTNLQITKGATFWTAPSCKGRRTRSPRAHPQRRCSQRQQDPPVAEDHHHQGQKEAEDEQTNNVGARWSRALVPLDRTGGADALWAVTVTHN